MIKLVAWFFLLILQNASFTWVSRARNSGSLGYHAIAAVGSNGLFILNQFIIIDNFLNIIKTADMKLAAVIIFVYIIATVTGSVGMHYLSMNYLEKGKRTVGAK